MASKPKLKADSKPQSKDLVKAARRTVFIDSDKARKLREDKPTTSRALVLRNAKLALQGNLDPALKQRMSGREKLDLLAEDIVEQTTKAVAAPFDILKCLRIAQSQYDASLGEIAYLRDPHMFSNIIEAEISAQTRYDPQKLDPLKNPSYVARMVATKIHNQHMVASAWKIIGNILRELIDRGMSNKNVKALLKNDNKIRSLHFALFRMVEVIVDINQQRFSGLALNSAHYARYFKQQQQKDDPTDEPVIIFDHSELREAGLSFIDSIIIELCFPQAPYPKFVLYQILHDAAEESPRETKRFSQLMWDAVGDLSECVEMHQLLEVPLLTPEADEWKEELWQMPQEFDTWRDAQMMSLKASEKIQNIQDVVFPLANTFRKAVLDNLWIRIDQNYFRLTGKGIDELWMLNGERDFEPQWTSFYMHIPKSMSGSDDENSHKDRKKAKEPLAIADWPANGPDYEDMPGLQTVSNSSDDYSSKDEACSEASYVDSESEDDGFDTEEEGTIKRLVKEAIDYVIEKDLSNGGPPPRPTNEERQNNPFFNLLTSLRGRLFKRDPKLHAPSKLPTHARPKKASPLTEEATVEEGTDEEKPIAPSRKKKKKPKKKKRLASITSADQVPLSPAPAPVPVSPASPEIKSPPASSTAEKANKKTPASDFLASSTQPATQAISSTTTLPVFETATTRGESARAYLSSLEPQKAKSKTRSDQASIFSKDGEEPPKVTSGGIGRSIMSRLGLGKKKPILEVEEQKVAQKSWFSKLSTRAVANMHHLLKTSSDVRQGKGGMKWDDFVKLMGEMGFQCDPSTAGSSVRFIPPGRDDHPISIHKPHPKAYLTQWHLTCISKRLKNRYGWDEVIFLSQAGLSSAGSD